VTFYVGRRRDADRDGIPDKKDDCVFLAGPGGDFAGCPDFDGDGIPDKDDACPFEKGPACTMGCPDRDNDCVADKVDLCPDVWGTISNHGCNPMLFAHTGLDADDSFLVNLINYQPNEYWSAEDLLPPQRQGNERQSIGALNTRDSIVYVRVPEPGSDRYLVLNTSRIYFDHKKSDLSKDATNALQESINVLTKDQTLYLLVCGFTDDVGSEDYNLVLSLKRTQSVQKYLVEKGIDESRIILSGYGKKNPVEQGTTDAARAKNRRIEIKVVKMMSR
jgi:outer membrane protein OmpA-like peptidoglycan-associated protein